MEVFSSRDRNGRFFSSLAIIIVSLYDWFSLPGEAKFGLPARFEDFSPFLFVGSFFAGGWNSGPGMDPSSGKVRLCVEDCSNCLEGRITGDKGKFLLQVLATHFVWSRTCLRRFVPRPPSVSLSRNYAHNYRIVAKRSSWMSVLQ